MKDAEARASAARAEVEIARVTQQLDAISRQVASMPAQLGSTVDDVLNPMIKKFNDASDLLDSHAHLTQQLVDQVAHLTASVKGLIDHDNMLDDELDSIRTTVTRLDKNVSHMKNTFATLGKSA